MPSGVEKTRIGWLLDGERIFKIRLFVLTESTNVTDRQTDRRTPHDGISRACTASRGKNTSRTLTMLDELATEKKLR